MSDEHLIRIVKMTFKRDSVDRFLGFYKNSQKKIRDFEGCLQLELWREHDDSPVFFSYSRWVSEEALENYRESDLFHEIWRGTKRFFADRPEAYSLWPLPEFKK